MAEAMASADKGMKMAAYISSASSSIDVQYVPLSQAMPEKTGTRLFTNAVFSVINNTWIVYMDMTRSRDLYELIRQPQYRLQAMQDAERDYSQQVQHYNGRVLVSQEDLRAAIRVYHVVHDLLMASEVVRDNKAIMEQLQADLLFVDHVVEKQDRHDCQYFFGTLMPHVLFIIHRALAAGSFVTQ